MFAKRYGAVFEGDEKWRAMGKSKPSLTYRWSSGSTYVQNPPYFEGLEAKPSPIGDVIDARILGLFQDSITTDHISPAGSIKRDGPAGVYLIEHQVRPNEFNSYGARRGNHNVMMRGTFANVRIKNIIMGGKEGGNTVHYPSGEAMSIFDAAMRYKAEGVPLVVFAGKEYGTGSSRDWAAKGTRLLGIRAVIAQSFERIHRSNLVGMGVLPLVFERGPVLARPRHHRQGNGDHPRPRRAQAQAKAGGDHRRRRRQGPRGRGALPHRYRGGAPLLPARRHPALRAAQPGERRLGSRRPLKIVDHPSVIRRRDESRLARPGRGCPAAAPGPNPARQCEFRLSQACLCGTRCLTHS